MKKNRTFRSYLQNPSRRRTAALSLESLEDRHLLAANILASVEDSITSTSREDSIEMTVTSGDSVSLVIQMTATDSSIDPAAPVVRTASGLLVTPVASMDNAIGNAGRTVVTLGAGDYTIESSAQSGSTGTYRVDVSLLGDVDSADARVSDFETLKASAAVIQGTGGSVNHVTQLFFMQNGIDLTESQYDSGFDVNMDGSIHASELGLVESNQSGGTVDIDLQADVDGPVIENLGLVNDTGTSATDNVTTDAAVSGTVSDENLVTSLTVSLDGGTDVEVIGDLGDLSSGDFTLTRAILDQVAGGTLAEGPHTISLFATDELGNVSPAATTLSFVLIDNNLAPVADANITAEATEEQFFSFDLNSRFTDPNPGDVLTFTATGTPAWLSLNGGSLQGLPANDDVGSEVINVTATDSQGLTVSATIDLTIVNTPDAPVITFIPNQTQEEDLLFSLDLNNFVSDDDIGDVLTVSVNSADGVDGNGDPLNLGPLPDWLSFDDTTLILSGTPSDAEVGMTFGIFVVAVDAGGLQDSQFFEITVQDVNDSPTLVSEIPDDTIDEGQAYSLDLSTFFSDPDPGDSLTFTAEQADGSALPSWMSLNQSTGGLSGTPDEPDVGVTFEIVVTATDTFGATASDTYALTVNNVNDTPRVFASTFRVLPGAATGTVVGTVEFSDEDAGDTLTITASGADSGNFVVDSASGEITVAAGATLVDGATLVFTATATDAAGDSDSNTITVRVTDNDSPVATDDFGFETNDIDALTILASDLTSNDTDPDGDSLAVTSVDSSSANGATVTLVGDEINYNPRLATTLLELGPGESLTDTFSYTISDGNGGTATANVNVTVNGTNSVQFILRTFDVSGNEISLIQPGAEFDLRVFVQDIRPDAQGVFAPFLDVTYNALASVPATSDIVPGSTYSTVPSGDTNTPGLIDEVGGLDGFEPLGGGEFEVFRLRMQAGTIPGVINFASDPADDAIQHAVLVFLDDDPVANEQIVFGTASLTIPGLIPPLSGSVPGSNFANPMDTNNDGVVSPLDVLVVVNAMESANNNMYPDVTGDGVVSPLDALAIVNYLNGGTPRAPLSASESATESTLDVAGDFPTLESGRAALLSAADVEVVFQTVDSTPEDAVLAAWSAEDRADVAVDSDDDDRASNAIDAIFGELV